LIIFLLFLHACQREGLVFVGPVILYHRDEKQNENEVEFVLWPQGHLKRKKGFNCV
jgi:hypothetical protein